MKLQVWIFLSDNYWLIVNFQKNIRYILYTRIYIVKYRVFISFNWNKNHFGAKTLFLHICFFFYCRLLNDSIITPYIIHLSMTGFPPSLFTNLCFLNLTICLAQLQLNLVATISLPWIAYLIMELNTNDFYIIEIDVMYLGSKQRLVNHEEEGNLSCSMGVWENGRETISYYGLKGRRAYLSETVSCQYVSKQRTTWWKLELLFWNKVWVSRSVAVHMWILPVVKYRRHTWSTGVVFTTCSLLKVVLTLFNIFVIV